MLHTCARPRVTQENRENGIRNLLKSLCAFIASRIGPNQSFPVERVHNCEWSVRDECPFRAWILQPRTAGHSVSPSRSEGRCRLSTSSIPVRSIFGARSSRGSGPRLLLFTLECALGIVAVVLVAALAHWFGWLLPVALLLYLLIVVTHRAAVRILASGDCFALRGCGARSFYRAAARAADWRKTRPTRLRCWPSCWWRWL